MKQKYMNWVLVRGNVIEQKELVSLNSFLLRTRYTIQYTTEEGEEITEKITSNLTFNENNPVPVRYNPQKPKQFVIDEDAYKNATFFKEDIAQQYQMQGQGQSNIDTMQLQAQMLHDGVTTQEALNIRNTSIQAKSVIMSAQPTGNIVGGNGEMELKIEVTRSDGSQYQTTVKKAIPPVALPYIQVGRVVQVFYKPGDEQNITIGI